MYYFNIYSSILFCVFNFLENIMVTVEYLLSINISYLSPGKILLLFLIQFHT